ncbi:MAG TPA: hypothetical protein VIL47_03615 [Candidatus Bipolaricaulota bacterium]
MTRRPPANHQPKGRGARGVRSLYRLLWAAGLLLLLIDLWDYKHPEFDFEHAFGFYGLFGFLAYAAIVGAGWLWRKAVMREESYYDG